MSNLRQAAQQALEHVQEFKRRWMAVPPFGNKVNKATREAVTLAHMPVFQLEEALRAALEQDDRDRVWIEERKANWALQRKMAQENQERDRLQRFADSVDELGMDYERTGCDIAADGVCEALECCNVRTSALCQEQVRTQPVAWQWLNTAHFRKKLPADAEPGAWNPIYTHPPRREWRGLTDEEKADLDEKYGDDVLAHLDAVEAALKEKNHE